MLSILSGLAALVTFVCFILVLIQMFKRGSVGVAIACILLFFCCGAGQLLALVYGWVKAGEWKITKLMTVYTVAFAITAIGVGINPAPYQFIREELQVTGLPLPAGSKFDSRIDAALLINDFGARDAALAALAKDAGAEGEVGTVKRCLGKINNFSVRDDAAHAAALSLAKAGKMQAATDVAKSINDFGRRDQTLGALAKGEFGK
jgi:hypothetical protein